MCNFTVAHAQEVCQVVRYSEAVSTVLRPSAANSRMKAIYMFCNWLAERLERPEWGGYVAEAWIAGYPGAAHG